MSGRLLARSVSFDQFAADGVVAVWEEAVCPAAAGAYAGADAVLGFPPGDAAGVDGVAPG